MEHIKETILIEYCAGRLTSEQAEKVREHLDRCDQCRGRYEQQAKLWRQLDEVRVPKADVDLADRVIKQVESDRQTHDEVLPYRQPAAGMLRVAAVIALALASGHVLGLAARARWRQPEVNIYQAQLVDETEVTRSLRLDALGAGIPLGFYDSLTDEQLLPEGETP